MRIQKRFFALAMALLILLGALPLSNARALEDDGIIRVLLTKLQLTDQIKVALDGSYTLGSMAFQRGSQLLFSCESGSILLYYEGLSMDCGQTVYLTRHATEDEQENGFRVNGAYYLHPGDLQLTIRNGQLHAIMYAPIEEYLLGVVPYEMSDSFPLEALKAQAITARTYALRKKQASSSQDYDVVDNTNDQAYYGIQWENKNAIEAVRATRGICGIYKGNLAECFYSASNGGQTELVQHVWGKGDYDYLVMTDDPYDLENKNSMVLSYTLPKTIQTQNDLGVLQDVLLGALSEQMETLGYDGDTSNIRIQSVDGLKTTTPKYTDSPSSIMTKLYFTLSVQGRKPILTTRYQEEDVSIFQVPTATAEPTEQPETLGDFELLSEPLYVELSIFPEVEALCSLDINPGVDNELITVTETDTTFTLESRRYGHGVGMSQRGAECMAGNYNWTYEQILRFYYPGMSLGTVIYSGSMPTTVPYHFMATPGPAASPTPRPTLMPSTAELNAGEYKVIVNQIGTNSYLNLRSEPNTTSEVLHQLYYGQVLIVTEEADGWLTVKTDAAQGYVMAQYVERVEESK